MAVSMRQTNIIDESYDFFDLNINIFIYVDIPALHPKHHLKSTVSRKLNKKNNNSIFYFFKKNLFDFFCRNEHAKMQLSLDNFIVWKARCPITSLSKVIPFVFHVMRDGPFYDKNADDHVELFNYV